MSEILFNYEKGGSCLSAICPKCGKQLKSVWCNRGIPTSAGMSCECGFSIEVSDGGYSALFDLYRTYVKDLMTVDKPIQKNKDTEILNKTYEYLLKRQAFWDECIQKCFDENTLGTPKHLQAMFCGSTITELRMFIDALREAQDET